MSKGIFSDNVVDIARALPRVISRHRSSPDLQQALKAQDYYDYKHDILNHRIFYIDGNSMLQEDKYASNVRIPHPFFTEIVDQAVQYLLSNPIEVTVEDEGLEKLVKPYINEQFQLVLQEVLEGSSIKGGEFLYARTNVKDTLEFQVADSLNTIVLRNDDSERVVRYWQERVTVSNGKPKKVNFAEVWTSENVYFFVDGNSKGSYQKDITKELNPRPHVIAKVEDKTMGRSYGKLPFFELKNNKRSISDLAPIKALIDDYDLMAAFLSNNLQDFTDAIYVVSGYQGDDLSKLKHNIKSKKVVGTDMGGGVEIKTVDIPVEARSKKLDIDKEAIYKFGMGLDSTQVGDGNITNVVIRSRYALLDMKANKKQVRLNELVRWCLEMIVDDINRKNNTNYSSDVIDFEFVRESVIDTKEIADIEHLEAQTRALIVQSIVAVSSRFDDESTLRLLCEQFELDFDEVLAAVEKEQFKTFDIETPPVEVPEDVEES